MEYCVWPWLHRDALISDSLDSMRIHKVRDTYMVPCAHRAYSWVDNVEYTGAACGCTLRSIFSFSCFRFESVRVCGFLTSCRAANPGSVVGTLGPLAGERVPNLVPPLTLS